MRAQQVPQPTHRSTAAARYAPSLQPCRVHAGPRAALPSARASQQLEQQQPCSSDSLSHSSSRAELGQGDPLPQLGQQQQQRQCVQQPLLSSQLPLLTVVSAHQLWTMLHSLPAHAAETIPPEAVVLFREFLVRDSLAWTPCLLLCWMPSLWTSLTCQVHNAAAKQL